MGREVIEERYGVSLRRDERGRAGFGAEAGGGVEQSEREGRPSCEEGIAM